MAQTTNIGLYKLGAQSKLKDFPNLFNDDLDIIDSTLGYGFGQGGNPTVKAYTDALDSKSTNILQNDTSVYQKIVLIKSNNVYHLHYERYMEVENGTEVTTINSAYAPSVSVYGQCYYKQASGFALTRCTVDSIGNVVLSAVTYSEPVAGVWDVYWTKE